MSASSRKAIEPALSQQQNRRRRKNTSVANGDMASTKLLSSPVPKVASEVSSSCEDVGHQSTRLQRFVLEMRDEQARTQYISAVDTHVNKLLDAVRGVKERGKRGKAKSQATQLAEKKVDLNSPDSILAHANIRTLLNSQTFASLPLFYQYKLVKMLPLCDQQSTSQGWLKPSTSAFSNEYFTKAANDWCERLKDGKLTAEALSKKAVDDSRERSKLDPWKAKHFEPMWGTASLESRRVAASEMERIPRTIVPLISPATLTASGMSPQSSRSSTCNDETSNDTRIDEEVPECMGLQHAEPRYKTRRIAMDSCLLASELSTESVPDIDMQTETVCVESTIVSSDNVVISKPQHTAPATSKRIRLSGPEPQTSEIVSSVQTVMSKAEVKISQNLVVESTKEAPPVSAGPLSTVRTTRSGRQLTAPPVGKSRRNASRKRPVPISTNAEGVDVDRSLMICQRAVAQSANNKLFYVSNHGKIHQVNAVTGETEQISQELVTVSDELTPNNDTDQISSQPPEGLVCRAALAELPVSLPQGLEVHPAFPSDETITQNDIKQVEDKKEVKHKININLLPPTNILSNILESNFPQATNIHTNLPACIKGSAKNMIGQETVPPLQPPPPPSSRTDKLLPSLPYKLPDGITITPAFAATSNQVPVIQRTECQVSPSSHHTRQQVWLLPTSSGVETQSNHTAYISTNSQSIEVSPQPHGSTVNLCGELTRLPSQITVIPLGPAPSIQASPTAQNGHFHQTHQTHIVSTPIVSVSQPTSATNNDCACNRKALVACVKCTAFCHEDCIGISGVCANCQQLMRCNYLNAPGQAAAMATAIPVIANTSPTAAYFCPMSIN